MAELKADDWRNIEIEVYRKDVEHIIYFILEMVLDQKKKDKPMQGALTMKGDLMGGIFDRWINLIPESIVLNKIILPQVSNGADVEIISDFYHYDPKNNKAGTAPDVLGLKINNHPVAFCEFRDKWTPVNDMPQIEMKTFKENHRMVSLRPNIQYNDEYLIFIDSHLRIDYLLPFFDRELLKNDLHKSLIMDDETFIKSDKNHLIEQFNKIDQAVLENEKLGSIKVLSICKTKDFTNMAIKYPPRAVIKRIKSVSDPLPLEKKNGTTANCNIPLLDLCQKLELKNLYRFDLLKIQQHKEIKNNGIFNGDCNNILDISAENIEHIAVRKMNGNSMYIEASDASVFNGVALKPGERYKVELEDFQRDGSGEEYFTHKANVAYISNENCNNLFEALRKVISKYA